jgi:hypothetical protein
MTSTRGHATCQPRFAAKSDQGRKGPGPGVDACPCPGAREAIARPDSRDVGDTFRKAADQMGARAFTDRLSRPFFSEGGNFGGEPLGVVGIGIEVVADPLWEFDLMASRNSAYPGAAAALGSAAVADLD